MAFGFLLYLQWEAMLISYLATRVIVLPFDGISSLVENSDFKIGLSPGSSYEARPYNRPHKASEGSLFTFCASFFIVRKIVLSKSHRAGVLKLCR